MLGTQPFVTEEQALPFTQKNFKHRTKHELNIKEDKQNIKKSGIKYL